MAENIKTTVEELRKLINVDNVIGSPIETEDKILIPVMRMGVGFGAGIQCTGDRAIVCHSAGRDSAFRINKDLPGQNVRRGSRHA